MRALPPPGRVTPGIFLNSRQVGGPIHAYFPRLPLSSGVCFASLNPHNAEHLRSPALLLPVPEKHPHTLLRLKNEIRQLPLHSGVALDWGSAGAADVTAAAWKQQARSSAGRNRINPTSPASATAAAAAAAAAATRSSATGCSAFPGTGHHADGGCCFFGGEGSSVGEGVSGEEAMAQALIAGRAEQAYLEDRLRVSDHRLEQARGEALRLRAVLERWHGDFVLPAAATTQVRGLFGWGVGLLVESAARTCGQQPRGVASCE